MAVNIGSNRLEFRDLFNSYKSSNVGALSILYRTAGKSPFHFYTQEIDDQTQSGRTSLPC